MKKLLTISFTLILTHVTNNNSAGPIVHALLGDKFLDHEGIHDPEYRKSFIVGTLFPDIRYIAKIDRNHTHIKNVSLDTIRAEHDPFHAGLLFHSWVDETREKFTKQSGIYEYVMSHGAPRKHRALLVKLLEDEIMKSDLDGNAVAGMLTTLHPQEQQWGINDTVLTKWHAILTASIIFGPQTIMATGAIPKEDMFTNLTPKQLEEWKQLFAALAQDSRVNNYTHDLIRYMEKKLTAKPQPSTLSMVLVTLFSIAAIAILIKKTR